jgi:hypothetical protein
MFMPLHLPHRYMPMHQHAQMHASCVDFGNSYWLRLYAANGKGGRRRDASTQRRSTAYVFEGFHVDHSSWIKYPYGICKTMVAAESL